MFCQLSTFLLLACSATASEEASLPFDTLFSLPSDGAFTTEALFCYDGIPPADFHAAIDYCVEHGAFDESDARRSWSGLPFVREEDSRHSRITRYVADGSSFYARCDETTLDGSFLRRRYWKEPARLVTTFDRYEPAGEVRSGPLELSSPTGNTYTDLPPTLGILHRALVRTGEALELAAPGLALDALDRDSGSLELDMTSLSVESRAWFAELGAFHSVETQAASVSFELFPNPGIVELVATWRDAREKRLLRQSIVWDRASLNLQRYDEQAFLPGLEERYARTTVRMAPDALPGQPDELAIPTDRSVVRDMRYYEPVVYGLDADGLMEDDMVHAISLDSARSAAIAEQFHVLVGSAPRGADAEAPLELEGEAGDPLLVEVDELGGELMLVPGRITLPPAAVGSKIPFAFTFENLSAGPIEIERVNPDCGCIDFQLEDYVLAPGESTRLTGLQKVQDEHLSLKTIEVQVKGLDETVIAQIVTQGVQRLHAGKGVFPAGVIPAGKRSTVDLSVFHFDCADAEAPPQVAAGADWLDPATWTFDAASARSAAWIDPSRFDEAIGYGAFVAEFSLQAPLCPDDETNGLVWGTLVPEGGDAWPDLWVTLAPTVAEHSLVLPIEVTGARVTGVGGGTMGVDLLEIDIAQADAGSELAFRLTDAIEAWSAGNAILGVQLETELGEVSSQVLVVVQ